jgi:hypothetical protein
MLTMINQPWFFPDIPKKTHKNTTIDPDLLIYSKVLAAQ